MLSTITIRNFFILCICVCFTVHMYGQVFLSDAGRQLSGSRDIYKERTEALFINPAGLGQLDESTLKLQFLQPGFNSYSDALNRGFANKITFSNKELSSGDREQLLHTLKGIPFDFTSTLGVNWLSIYAGTPKLGGISLGVRDRLKASTVLNGNSISFLILGKDALDFTGSSTAVPIPENWQSGFINFRHFRSIDIGYGRSVIDRDALKIHAGLGVSRLYGIGYLKHRITDGESQGTASFSDFYNIDYKNIHTIGDFGSKLISSAGKGFSFNAGIATIFIKDEFEMEFGVSVLNIGSLKWQKNVIESTTSTLNLSGNRYRSGLESFNFEREADYLFQAFRYESKENLVISEKLAGQLRLNGVYAREDNLALNFDLLTDIGESIYSNRRLSFVVGAGWSPLPQFTPFRVHGGILYHSIYNFRLPLGVSLQLNNKFDMITISTNDFITLFDSGENPLTSVSFSFIGYRL